MEEIVLPLPSPQLAEQARHALISPETVGESAIIISVTTKYQCAGCGEWNDTFVDPSGGRRQSYVEDCQVCCKPNVLKIEWDASADAWAVVAELE